MVDGWLAREDETLCVRAGKADSICTCLTVYSPSSVMQVGGIA